MKSARVPLILSVSCPGSATRFAELEVAGRSTAGDHHSKWFHLKGDYRWAGEFASMDLSNRLTEPCGQIVYGEQR